MTRDELLAELARERWGTAAEALPEQWARPRPLPTVRDQLDRLVAKVGREVERR